MRRRRARARRAPLPPRVRVVLVDHLFDVVHLRIGRTRRVLPLRDVARSPHLRRLLLRATGDHRWL